MHLWCAQFLSLSRNRQRRWTILLSNTSQATQHWDWLHGNSKKTTKKYCRCIPGIRWYSVIFRDILRRAAGLHRCRPCHGWVMLESLEQKWQRRTNSETYPKDSGQTKNSRVTFCQLEVATRFEWNLRLNKGRREVDGFSWTRAQSQCAHIGHHQRHMFKFCDDPCQHDGTTGLETPGNVLLNPCPGRERRASGAKVLPFWGFKVALSTQELF